MYFWAIQVEVVGFWLRKPWISLSLLNNSMPLPNQIYMKNINFIY